MPKNPQSQHLRTRKFLRSWFATTVLGAQLYCHAVVAQATTQCEIPASSHTPQARLNTLRTMEPQCNKQAHFLYALGHLLNQSGQYAEAIDPLEGAILYQPDHWPSQLEYAIALEGIGDHASALGLLRNLVQNPEIDAPTRQQIQFLQNRALLPVKTGGYGTLNFATGFDDNLQRSTYHQQFVLTTPSGYVPVFLDEAQRPQAGTFFRAEVSYGGELTRGASAQWLYSLGANLRNSPGYPGADQGQWGGALVRSSLGENGTYLQGQYLQMQRAGSTVLEQTQLGWGYDFKAGPSNACNQRWGLNIQRLTYPDSADQDGHYAGIVGNISCQPWGLQVQLSAGNDQPVQSSRLGGVQRQIGLRIGKTSRLSKAIVALEWEAYNHQDQSGYSLLLENNAKRSINRHFYRIEYRWQAGKLNPYLGLEWLDQQSNLPLFELKSRAITLGFRSSW